MASLHTLFYFLVAIAVLVTFHEFGHFWVARKLGVKVLRFSIGFGKVLWSYRQSAQATEFALSLVPMGGYVKMVDEREGEVAPEDLPYAFNRQPVSVRTAIVAAGPIFNLLLAIFLFWCVLVLGETGVKPILGKIEANTLAADAGFIEGDEILRVDENPAPTWSEAMDVLISKALEGQHDIVVAVRSTEGDERMRVITLQDGDIQDPETLYTRLGLTPWTPLIKPVIGKVLPDSPALQAGLKPGDLLLSADGILINDWQQWVKYVQDHPEKPIDLLLERDAGQLHIVLTPKAAEQNGQKIGKIGAGVEAPKELMQSMLVEHRLSPLKAIPAALQRTWLYSIGTLKMMGRMFVGEASVDNLSGPISIAQFAGQSAQLGLVAFLKFLGVISVSLGVLNLLPIPVLDGGHLFFYAVEAVMRRPISDKTQLYFQQMGMALLFTLMLFAMFLDLDRIFQ